MPHKCSTPLGGLPLLLSPAKFRMSGKMDFVWHKSGRRGFKVINWWCGSNYYVASIHYRTHSTDIYL